MSAIFHLNLIQTVVGFGYLGLFVVIFIESGFFAFFLPGASLLFAVGLIASAGTFNIVILTALMVIAAILGDSAGYAIGRHFGRGLFERESFFLRREYLRETEKFFRERGSSAVVLARFVPIVRTFTPVVAGIALMPYRKFLWFNIVGAILWGAGLTLAGYFLGGVFPAMQSYLWLISALIIVASGVPLAWQIFKSRTI